MPTVWTHLLCSMQLISISRRSKMFPIHQIGRSDKRMQWGVYIPGLSYGTLVSVHLRVVILTMFFYNFILTFDDEVAYIWSKAFSFGTIFYIVGRYLAAASVIYSSYKSGFTLILDPSWTGSCDIPGFPSDPDDNMPCIVNVEIQDSGEYGFPFRVMFYVGAIVAVCAMVLLQLRTYALYNKSKPVLYLFCVLNALALIFFIIEVTVFSRLQSNVNLSDTVFGVEYFGSKTNYSPLFWAPFLLNEVVTFLLVLNKSWKNFRTSRIPGASKSNLSLSSIIIRDNMIYFSVIFIVYLFGMLIMRDFVIIALANTQLLASVAISGILAPNLFLMLKKGFYSQGQYPDLASDATAFHATRRSDYESQS